MQTGFLPPVVLQIQANATQAIASMKGVNTQLSIMEAKALKTGVALTKWNKAAIIGTGALKALGLATAAFAGISVKMAMDVEKSYIRLGKALANQGLSTEQNRKELAVVVDSYEQLGFAGERAADAMSVLITATQDTAQSQKLLALAADLARNRNMGLEEAARALARAQGGATRIFTQFGITIDKTKPKAEGIALAMAELEKRIGGSAQTATKSLSVKFQILGESIGNVFETVGMKLIPIISKSIDGIMNLGKAIGKNKDLVVALAITITVMLIPAVVNLTKKLITLSLTILRAPWFRAALLIGAIAYAFVKAYNSSEEFRKGIASVGKFVVTVFQSIAEGAFTLVNVVLLLVRGFANLGIVIGKVFNRPDMVKGFKGTLDSIDNINAKLAGVIDKFEQTKKSIDEGSKKKLTFDFKTLIPKIPGFENLEGGGKGKGAGKPMSDALIAALQKITDFRTATKKATAEIKASWKSFTGRDVQQAIQDGLANPLDQLVKKAQTSANEYAKASSSIKSAITKAEAAQNAYAKAVGANNKKAIASTESAMNAANKLVTDLQDKMQKALENLAQYQQDMIDTIIEAEQGLIDLEKQRLEVLAKYGADEIELRKNLADQKEEIQKDYDKNVLRAQEDAANRTKEIIKSSINSLRDIYRSATSRSIGDIYSSLTFEGRYIKGGNITALTETLKKQVGKAQNLANKASALAGKGFTQTFIEQVVSMGPDLGGQLADSILAGSPESIEQLKSYWDSLDKLSQHGVDALSQHLYDTLGLATEELREQMTQVGVDLKKSLAEYQTALAEDMLNADKEFNKALAKLQKDRDDDIEKLKEQVKKYKEQIAQLQSALAQMSTLSAPGVKAAAPNLAPQATTGGLYSGGSSLAIGGAIIPIPSQTPTTPTGGTKTPAATGTPMGIVGGTTIYMTNNTNASPSQIATDVAWAIRTSSDLKYASVGMGAFGSSGQITAPKDFL